MYGIAADCSVELRAYSYCTHCDVGYVKLNGRDAWRASWCAGDPWPNERGVTTLLIDPFNCTVQESHLFDTHGSANDTTQLSIYLQLLNHGSIVVAVTGDEPSRNLDNALITLQQLGVEVGDVLSRGSFGFIAQKGFPHKTVLRKVLTEAESNVNPASFNATITG